MEQINKLNVVLIEQQRTSKRPAKASKKNEATVSCWCTNESQPSLETLIVTNVDVKELLISTKKQQV